MEERQYSPAEVRRKLGVSHPLSKFALPDFVDGACADVIVGFIANTVFKEPDTAAYQSARWFLLESSAFLHTCAEAGLDGARLREHLRKKLKAPR